MSQAELGERAGVKQNTISKWEKNKSAPDRNEAARLARVLNISHLEIEGFENVSALLTIPFMGYVGAGSQVYGLENNEIEPIEAPPGSREGDIAFIIRGGSMAPFSEGGTIIARPVSDLSQIIYKLAVVDLSDGRRFFKRVLPSPVLGVYALARADGEIEERDVKITSAALFRVYVEPE